MKKSFSVYLDAIRFAAAFAVVLNHLSLSPITNAVIPKPLAIYGSAAVTIFFLLSGYVISYVTETRERNAIPYSISRISRLYSVVVPALILTLLLDHFGGLLNPAFYLDSRIMPKPSSVAGYVSSFFFVNEYQVFGFHGISPGSNAPYWSLSFEATYYALAGLMLFGKRLWALVGTVAILALAGPTIAVLFPIWIAGFFLCRSTFRISSERMAKFGAYASLIVIAVSPVAGHFASSDKLGLWLPWGRIAMNRNIVGDYAAAIGFAWHILCVRSLPDIRILLNDRVARIVRWAGSLTFPLYLIHFPAACFFAAISPIVGHPYLHLVYVLATTMLTVFAFSPLCELMRQGLRRVLSAIARKWDLLPPPSTAAREV